MRLSADKLAVVASPKEITPYRLDGEIARGGMGAIIKARDTDLGRDLAIKVLLDEHKNNPEVVQRFIEEVDLLVGGRIAKSKGRQRRSPQVVQESQRLV